jgi:hypothetical protein
MTVRQTALARGAEEPAAVARARAIARTLDAAVRIPGVGVRFGLDAVLGLVPGLGDVAGAALSAYVVLVAARLGAPASVVGRMLGNVALDTAMGTIPLLGDAFDVGWKSNTRNVRLLEGWLQQPEGTTKASRLVVAGAVVVLVLLGIAGVAAAVFVLRAISRAIG